MKQILFIYISALFTMTAAAGTDLVTKQPGKSAGKKTASRRPAQSDDPEKAIEVRGQSRNLSMMLSLKNGKNDINFIKPRLDYNPEIKQTEF